MYVRIPAKRGITCASSGRYGGPATALRYRPDRAVAPRSHSDTAGTVPDMSRADVTFAWPLWPGQVCRKCDFSSTTDSAAHVGCPIVAYLRPRHAAVQPGIRT